MYDSYIKRKIYKKLLHCDITYSHFEYQEVWRTEMASRGGKWMGDAKNFFMEHITWPIS